MSIKEIKPVECRNIRVLTTQQLAEEYGVDHKILSKNFERNKDRYVEGKHFICLTGEELREFKTNRQNDVLPNANKLYLWTKKGAFLHAKSLNTDIAWELYDGLVDSYFEKQEEKMNYDDLSEELQMFFKMGKALAKQELEQKRQAEQMNRIEEKQDMLAETFRKLSDKEDFKAWCKKCISKITKSPMFGLGLSESDKYQLAWSESYDRLNEERPCRLKQRVKTAQGEALQNGATPSKAKEINQLTIIAADKDLKPVYEMVIKEMVSYYCIN